MLAAFQNQGVFIYTLNQRETVTMLKGLIEEGGFLQVSKELQLFQCRLINQTDPYRPDP